MAATVQIRLPDGSIREMVQGSTVADLAAAIGARLAKAALVARVDGELVDLTRELTNGSEVAIITPDSREGRDVLRHSTAHVLAQAVLRLWPGAKYAIVPP